MNLVRFFHILFVNLKLIDYDYNIYIVDQDLTINNPKLDIVNN